MQTLQVEGMSCSGCVKSVESALLRADPVAKVSIDLPSGRVEIESELSSEALVAAIEAAGYDVKE
ncbi:MAG: cation transporter [Ancalomicrobiaceae bacterium]|nr:cation transporter [Ancalomicrobiaceae bacterium]